MPRMAYWAIGRLGGGLRLDATATLAEQKSRRHLDGRALTRRRQLSPTEAAATQWYLESICKRCGAGCGLGSIEMLFCLTARVAEARSEAASVGRSASVPASAAPVSRRRSWRRPR